MADTDMALCPGLGPAAESGPPAPQRRSGPPRLLLIDDEPEVARFIGHALEEFGYRPTVTITADSFRRAFETIDPDVVAIDLAMPGSDGIELLRFLADRRARATVLIVSGFDGRVVEAAMRLGRALGLRMARPLTKPVRVQQLIDAIREAEAEAGR